MQPVKKVVKKKEQPNVDKAVQIKKQVKKKTTPAQPATKSKKSTLFPKLGQVKATPPENDAVRRFYTSLLAQNPKSEMAKKWCVEHGLYPKQEDNIHVTMAKLSI